MVATYDVSDQLRRRCTEKLYQKTQGMGNLPYNERLKILNIDRLEIRRIKFDLVLLYKIVNNLVDLDIYDFLEFSNTITRGHQFKLRIKPSTTKNYKFLNSFRSRSVHIWNSFTSSIVICSSIAAFKRKLKLVNLSKFRKPPYA